MVLVASNFDCAASIWQNNGEGSEEIYCSVADGEKGGEREIFGATCHQINKQQ